ncbi:MAG: tetratricopeptide repeat protein, partial [Bacteroidales bacterium]
KNLALSKQRMEASMNYLISKLTPETRKTMKKSTVGEVATWKEVADLVRVDYPEEAASMDKLISKHGNNFDRLSAEFRKQPYYGLLAETYLPVLRRTQYFLTYSVNRVATDAEILDLFSKRSLNYTEYEYWRKYNLDFKNASLVSTERQENEKRVAFLSNMLKAHPNSVWAAINLSAYNLLLGKPDSKILSERSMKQGEPQGVYINQILTLLAFNDYETAKEVSKNLGSDDNANYLKAVLAVNDGKYGQALKLLDNQNCLNKVLLLLRVRNNELAYREVMKLNTGTAEEFYVKAICSNRLNKINEALEFLKKAIALDPSLKEKAIKDSDINDLL